MKGSLQLTSYNQKGSCCWWGLCLYELPSPPPGGRSAAMSRLAGGAPPIVTTRDVYNYLSRVWRNRPGLRPGVSQLADYM